MPEPSPSAPFQQRSPEEHARWKRDRPARRRRHPLYQLKRRIINLASQPPRLRFMAFQVALIQRDHDFPRQIAVYAQAICHRDCEKVRREARAHYLAYAFLRNVPFLVCEIKPHREQNAKLEAQFWKRVESIITEFDASDIRVIRQRINEWRAPADAVNLANIAF
jgi:hypothetical protein